MDHRTDFARSNSSELCPPKFVALVLAARASRADYADVGYALACVARNEAKGAVEPYVLDDLDAVLKPHPERMDRLWSWLRKALPTCMAFVPSRRKESFLRGVERALEEGRI